MIALINGKLLSKETTELIVDCAGVGYELSISMNTYDAMPGTGNDVMLYVYMHFRQDVLQLYGFSEREEKQAFLKLISVSGIGPKVALGVLSSIRVDELAESLVKGEVKKLVKLPGVGKKTAERMIVELKDKFSIDKSVTAGKAQGVSYDVEQEAYAALLALGYTAGVAEKTIRQVVKESKGEELNAEKLIKYSLRRNMS